MWFLCLALKTVGPQWQSHNNSNTVGSRHDILLRISCLDPHLILTIHCPHDTGGIHQRNLLKFQIFIGSFHFWHLSEWRNSKLRLVGYPVIYLLLFIAGRFCIGLYTMYVEEWIFFHHLCKSPCFSKVAFLSLDFVLNCLVPGTQMEKPNDRTSHSMYNEPEPSVILVVVEYILSLSNPMPACIGDIYPDPWGFWSNLATHLEYFLVQPRIPRMF